MGVPSRLDAVYRSLLLSRFFVKGWGKPEHLKRIFALRRLFGERSEAIKFVKPDHPVEITKHEVNKDHQIYEGRFVTPYQHLLPETLPPECATAYFQLVLPLKNRNRQPICVQYAGTGDHFFWRRRHFMALPLVRERGIGSIILENPFYGLRKPKDQFRSCLRNVADLFVMGGCLMMESLVLFHWCERQGYGPLIAHGISMGGHMASLGATVWPKPIALVPCLSWTSASQTFTKGVMTDAIPWDVLQHQYYTFKEYREELKNMVRCEENAFQAGIEYAQRLGEEAEFRGQTRREFVEESRQKRREERNLEKSGIEEKPKVTKSIVDTLAWPIVAGEKEPIAPGALDDRVRADTISFMRGIMDECTHLRNYSVPVDPNLIIIVAAERDAYQPREGIMALPDIWPGAQMRFIRGKGHVQSYLFNQREFRQAIYDALEMLERKLQTGESAV